MLTAPHETFSLHNFEGPIEFLLHLIQKDEIDIYDVSLQSLTAQFLKKWQEWQEGTVEKGAEFIGTLSYLVLLKSRALLPRQDLEETVEEEEDPHFEIIHHLIDYCRFKQAAKILSERQDQQNAYFVRGTTPYEWKKPLGIEHISLDDLAALVQNLMSRTTSKPQIQEEHWRVADKIHSLRLQLKKESTISFYSLFTADKSRPELIVTFLAVLELMKLGEMTVGKETASQTILLFAYQPLEEEIHV